MPPANPPMKILTFSGYLQNIAGMLIAAKKVQS
jgi:hypothetical protein